MKKRPEEVEYEEEEEEEEEDVMKKKRKNTKKKKMMMVKKKKKKNTVRSPCQADPSHILENTPQREPHNNTSIFCLTRVAMQSSPLP
jgi:hypothetical protein